MRALYAPLCLLLAVSLVAPLPAHSADTLPDPPTASICIGPRSIALGFRDSARFADSVSVPSSGRLIFLGSSAPLRLYEVARDKDLDLSALGSPLLVIPFIREYRADIADLVAAAKDPASADIVVVVGAKALRLRPIDVLGAERCADTPPAPEAGVEHVRALIRGYEETAKLFKSTDARTELEFAENAIVRIDARTGAVTPQARVRLRRGHYVIVVVDNGFIVKMRHEQSMAEGGTVLTPLEVASRKALTSDTGLESASATLRSAGILRPGEVLGITTRPEDLRTRIVEEALKRIGGALSVPGGSPDLPTLHAELKSLVHDAKSSREAAILMRSVEALEDIISKVPERARGGWVRAAYRETVYRVFVVPEKAGTAGESDPSAARDVVLTLNAQKWGSEVGAGFVFAAPGDQTFTYGPETEGKKEILESSASAATPFPTLYLNLWMWERPQWGASLAVGVKTEDARITYGLGLSYLFSRRAQVTVGALLVPQTRLPSGYRVGMKVPVGDNTLLSLGTETRLRFFLGLAWRFGGGEAQTGAETNPKPPGANP